MKKIKVSMIFNFIIFVLVLLGTIFMVSGIEFMKHVELLSVSRLEAFKYFTVDSNILVGLSAFALFVAEAMFLNKKKDVPNVFYILKYVATCGVVLTFLVTAFFLAPFSTFSYFDFYQNSNLFFHFIVPILSVISFVFFEKEHITFKHTFLSLIPMICYSIYYFIMVIPHIHNGEVSSEYDFYGFLRGGAGTIYFVFPIMLIIMYAIGYLLYFVQKKKD